MTRKTWSLLLSLMLALGGVGLFFGCGDDDGGSGGECGNGIIEEGEECDGDNLDATTCEDFGYTGGELACGDDCQFDVSGCITDLCGNGELDAGEDCDGDELGGETCEDLGFSGGELGCNDDCSFDMDACEGGCGNGVVDGDDECDGDDLDGETCDSLGYAGGTLSCTDECVFDVASCEEPEELCSFDETVQIDSLGLLELTVDTSIADDTVDVSCEAEALGASDYIFAVEVMADGDLVVNTTNDWHIFALFTEPEMSADCFDAGHELKCFDPYYEGMAGMFSGLTEGTYYLVVSDWSNEDSGEVEFTLTLGCPEGTHEEEGICVTNTCAYLDCESMDMVCDDTQDPPVCQHTCVSLDCGSMNMVCDDTQEPPICDGCAEGYVEGYNNRCIVEGLGYGSPCEKDADCPGTGEPGSEIVCGDTTSGSCMSIMAPECDTAGEPCTDDASSVCLVFDYYGNDVYLCAHACETDDDCRPGYRCNEDSYGSGYAACEAIWECGEYGCNDANGDLFCNEEEGSDDYDMCWIDGCETAPCDSVDNSTGVCINSGDSYACECGSEYVWDPDTMACEDFTCPADDLGTWDGTAIGATGDSCNGTLLYGNSSLECTGFQAAGEELVYSLTVPDGETIVITQTPVGESEQDSALYILTACNDLNGATCLAGADETYGGEAETLTWTNETGEALMIYIVADAFSGCGEISLDIQ